MENKNRSTINEPIAIIGVGCRLPCDINDLSDLWNFLIHGKDAIVEIPHDRWDVDKYFDPDPQAVGKMYTKKGSFINNISHFDPYFFGISPREAKGMDPQQRLILEVAWETLENAGCMPINIHCPLTGVFIGQSWHDYERAAYGLQPERIDVYNGLGNSPSITAGRVSYTLGIHGPSMIIDTACSSSLVAIHQACQSLILKECDLALAGGVNLLISPLSTIFCCRLQAISPTGHCKPFSAEADGFIRGEGCALVALKRLSDVTNENVLAVIKSTVVNHNGRSSGLTVPNKAGQIEMIRYALQNANLKPEQIAYIEAHGTGTILGDPIEIHALSAVFGTNRLEMPLIVGSIKSNLGHLETAAGIAGLLKTILVLKNKIVPHQIHYSKPNPNIEWENHSIVIPISNMNLKHEHLIAGVNSFGFSGTNAHVILEEAPKVKRLTNTMERPYHILVLSAKDKSALRELVLRYIEFFNRTDALNIADICYTAATGRKHFSSRLAITIQGVTEAKELLTDWLANKEKPCIVSGEVESQKRHKIGFLFTGEGSQYRLMGKVLYETNKLFRDALLQCDKLLLSYLGESILTIMYDSSKDNWLIQPCYVQPALFVLGYGLLILWDSWGLYPEIVVGYGVGEYLAAYAAGMLNLDDALRLAVLRGQLLSKSATINQEQLSQIIGRLADGKSSCTFISSLTKNVVDENIDWSNYWCEQINMPPNSLENLQVLASSSCDTIIEIGPQAIFSDFIKHPVKKIDVCVYSLYKDGNDWYNLLHSLSILYTKGINIDWNKVDGTYYRYRLALPTYPFQKQYYWEDPIIFEDSGTNSRFKAQDISSTAHPLLTKQLHSVALKARVFESFVHSEWPTFIKQHKLFDTIVVAGATYVSALITLVLKNMTCSCCRLEKLTFIKPLIIQNGEQYNLQIILEDDKESWMRFEVLSINSKNSKKTKTWNKHLQGLVDLSNNHLLIQRDIDINYIQSSDSKSFEGEYFYRWILDSGANLGQSYRWIKKVWCLKNIILGEIQTKVEKEHADAYVLHPGLIDSFFQLLFAKSLLNLNMSSPIIHIPISIDEMIVNYDVDQVKWIYVEVNFSRSKSHEVLFADITLLNHSISIVGTIKNLACKAISKQLIVNAMANNVDVKSYLYKDKLQAKVKAFDVVKSNREGKWIFFLDSAFLQRLVHEFEKHLATSCIKIFREKSENQKNISLDTYFVNLADETSISKILKECFTVPIGGIVYAYGLTDLDEKINDFDTVSNEQKLISTGLLSLLRNLLLMPASELPPFFLLTAYARDNGTSHPINLVQAPLIGLYNTFLLEHPDVVCLNIDIDLSNDAITALINEFLYIEVDKTLIFRKGKRYASKLMNYEQYNNSSFKFSSTASYIITGGTGGLGLKVAEWLITKGAKRVILLGRTLPSSEIQTFIDSLVGNVTFIQTDVHNKEQLLATLKKVNYQVAPIKGVIHAAGVIADGLLLNQNWDQFSRVFTPKVVGVWHLHDIIKELKLELDFLVLFSSSAATLGSSGQSNYAAANAAMDALSIYMRKQGQPTITINWGPWDEVGMAIKNSQNLIFLEKRGLSLLSVTEALSALELIVSEKCEQITVIKIDWQTWKNKHGDESSVLKVINNDNNQEEMEEKKFYVRLNEQAFTNRKAFLDNHLIKLVMNVLSFHNQPIDKEISLSDVGMDSLMALEFRNKLQSDLDNTIELPFTLVFEYSSISKISNYILQALENKNVS